MIQFAVHLLVMLTFPITFLTLGLFIWVVNAFMLKLTAAFVPGFKVEGFQAAMVGSVLLGASTSRCRVSSGSRTRAVSERG